MTQNVKPDLHYPSASTGAERAILLEADLADPPDTRLARALVLLGLLGVFFAIFWSYHAPVREVVVGEGQILPIVAHQTVQHVDGGRIKAIYIQEGALVEEGDVLVEFDRSDELALVAQLEVRAEALRAELARMSAFAEEKDYVFPSSELVANAISLSQEALFHIQTEERKVRVEALSTNVELARARQAEVLERIELLSRREFIQAKRFERLAQLADTTGSVAIRDVEAAELALLDTKSELSAAQAGARVSSLEVAQARKAIKQFELEQTRADADAASHLQSRLAETQTELDRYRMIAARDTVRAPVRGRIQSLTVTGRDNVVQPGSEIATVVPLDRELIAELTVPANQIGTISHGHLVGIKVLTFDFTRFGTIEGRVVDVSPTSSVSSDGTSSYKIRVRLSQSYVGSEAAELNLRPGLAVVGDIVLGERTVLEYLLKPLRAAKDRAFSES